MWNITARKTESETSKLTCQAVRVFIRTRDSSQTSTVVLEESLLRLLWERGIGNPDSTFRCSRLRERFWTVLNRTVIKWP